MANTISTSTNATATGYSPSQLVAMSVSGDAFVLWFDGTNVKYSYATSPYSSWTTTTLAAAIGGGPRWQAGLYKLSNDDVLVCTSNSAANMVSYYFTYSSGGHSWSPGGAVTVEASSVHSNGGSVAMDADAQGRIWAAWANNSHVVQVYYTGNSGTSWIASTTITEVSGGDDTAIGLAYVGNYIVAVVCMASAIWKYQRIDAHSASLGSWSTATAIANTVMDNAADISFRGAPGSNYGVWAGDEYSAVPAQYYNAGSDTWSSITNIGASTNDRQPTLVSDGANLYCLWCKYSAANNYYLVYKKFTASTQTWDTSSTQLEANGTNIQWPNGGYGNSTLAFVYLVGTATPWTVSFDTASFSSLTTNTMSFTDTLTGSDTLLDSTISQMSDALTTTDSLNASDAATLTDLLSASDALNATENAALSDGLNIADSAQSIGTYQPSDTLAATETEQISTAYQTTDTLTMSETSQSVAISALVEALSASESMAVLSTLLPNEVLTVLQSALYSSDALVADLLTALDTYTLTNTIPGGVTTNAMSFTDLLTIVETLLAGDAYVPVDGLSVADALSSQEVYQSTETLGASDGLNAAIQARAQDALTASDTSLSAGEVVFTDLLSPQTHERLCRMEYKSLNTYIDCITYKNAATGLTLTNLFGAMGRIVSVSQGAMSLTLTSALATVALNQYDALYLFDGPQSEMLQIGSGGASIGATVIPLASATVYAHTGGQAYCTDGVQGSLGQAIVEASSWLEDLCYQSLWQATYTGEQLPMPTQDAALDNQGGLNFRPLHFPFTSLAALSITTGDTSAATVYDPTQAQIDALQRLVAVPILKPLNTGSESNLVGQFTRGLSRNQKAMLTITYTAGFAPGALPPVVTRAITLLVNEQLGLAENPIGADQITQGKRTVIFTLRGDPSGDSLLVKRVQTLLARYTVRKY